MDKLQNLKEWCFDKLLKPVLLVVVAFLVDKIYKTSPGDLRVIRDPFSVFLGRLDDVIVKYFKNVLDESTREKFLGDNLPVGNLYGWWEFDKIGHSGSDCCVKLTEGENAIVVTERIRGKSNNIDDFNESSFNGFFYVQVITSVGVVWIEEIVLSSKL